MKYLYAVAAGLMLTACTVKVEHDGKSGDVKAIHISIANFDHAASEGTRTETRQVMPLTSLETAGPVNLEVEIGPTPSLTVSGDADLVAKVLTEQKGDHLVVRMETGISVDTPPTVHLVTPTLAALRNTGSGDIEIKGLDGSALTLDSTGSGDTSLSGKVASLTAHMVGSGDLDAEHLQVGQLDINVLGSGDAKLGEVSAEHVEAAVHGSGSVTASGSTKSLKGALQGSGDLNLAGLHAESVEVDVLGSGDASVFASQSVRAYANGTGNIHVHGKPPTHDLRGENATLE